MNVAILTGRPTAAPDVRKTDSTTVARFTLAVDRRGEGTDFPTCVAFGKTAEFAEKYVKKGTKYAVTGEIRTGSYEGKNGKVYTTEVIVNHIEFCERKTDDFTPITDSEAKKLPFA